MIHPLKVENIKGSSINLTASKFAWRISDGKSAVNENKIVIPPNDTVCIYTEEAIWVSRRIGGTYHSKVSQTSKGLGHIATTLDPQWYGLSLVAVPNHTSRPIDILVGSSFVTVMLGYVNTPSTKGLGENAASRPDISKRFEQSDEEELFLNSQWHRSYEGIKDAMINSESYKKLVKDKNKVRQEIGDIFRHPLVSAIIGGVVVAVVLKLLGIK